jgi:glucose-6-phosphate dehydrogenase assembly protein OpcA
VIGARMSDEPIGIRHFAIDAPKRVLAVDLMWAGWAGARLGVPAGARSSATGPLGRCRDEVVR